MKKIICILAGLLITANLSSCAYFLVKKSPEIEMAKRTERIDAPAATKENNSSEPSAEGADYNNDGVVDITNSQLMQCYDIVLDTLGLTMNDNIGWQISVSTIDGEKCCQMNVSNRDTGEMTKALVRLSDMTLIELTKDGEAQDNKQVAVTDPREKALLLALDRAGVQRENAYDIDVENDIDLGVEYWEVDFKSQGFEYEAKIKADSMEIVIFNKEIDD